MNPIQKHLDAIYDELTQIRREADTMMGDYPELEDICYEVFELVDDISVSCSDIESVITDCY